MSPCQHCNCSARQSLPVVVFILGGPGSGKGTQSGLLSFKFQFTHLSAGDLLREERKNPDSEFGELIESCIKEGKIVPVEITVALIHRAMQTSGSLRFLIDGFPRNADNLTGWRKLLTGKVDERACLFLDCPESVMEKRLIGRGETSGRSDDNLDSIRKRFATYENETRPILEVFRAEGKLLAVNADRAVEEVWKDVEGCIRRVL